MKASLGSRRLLRGMLGFIRLLQTTGHGIQHRHQGIVLLDHTVPRERRRHGQVLGMHDIVLLAVLLVGLLEIVHRGLGGLGLGLGVVEGLFRFPASERGSARSLTSSFSSGRQKHDIRLVSDLLLRASSASGWPAGRRPLATRKIPTLAQARNVSRLIAVSPVV